jgi:hypothetical protein
MKRWSLVILWDLLWDDPDQDFGWQITRKGTRRIMNPMIEVQITSIMDLMNPRLNWIQRITDLKKESPKGT